MTGFRQEKPGRLPLLLHRHVPRRRQVVGAGVGLVAEIVAIIVFSAVDTANGWVGVGGAVGVLIAVFVAIAAGTLPGVVVAAVGIILFVILIAYAQPPDPVAGGAIIVVVWCTAAAASGAKRT